MKKFSKVILLLLASWCSAQNYTGVLQPVSQNGITEIAVDPELRSAVQNNWNSFRILDSKKKEVPYALNATTISGEEDVIQNLNIISITSVPNVSTTVIISNENRLQLDLLTLTIANTEVVKTYAVSGSNDQNQWFGLINSETVSDLSSATKTQVQKDFHFPLNNYRFLKIDFVDKKSLPIEVLAATVRRTGRSVNSPLLELKNFGKSIKEDKVKKVTQVTLTFNSRQIIDGIKFTISEPKFYRRSAEIMTRKSRQRNRKTENYVESVANFHLYSKTINQFAISELFEKEIIIEIENQDSTPLTIENIHLYQQPVTLLSELKASEKYTILIDSALTRPQYDLAYLDNNVQAALPRTRITDLTKVEKESTDSITTSSWKSPIFMWICIGLALLVIAYFSRGLLKDLGNNQ